MEALELMLKLGTLAALCVGFGGVLVKAGSLVHTLETLSARTAKLEDALARYIDSTERRLHRLEARDASHPNPEAAR